MKYSHEQKLRTLFEEQFIKRYGKEGQLIIDNAVFHITHGYNQTKLNHMFQGFKWGMEVGTEQKE